jgi:hypothetical protein
MVGGRVMRKLLLATTFLTLVAPVMANAAAVPACNQVAPNFAASAGGFGTLDGTLYVPDGTPFVARGVDVMEGNQPSAAELQAAFPGINMVRLAIYDYASPASLSAYVADLTSHGIVVEIEHHIGAGGGVPPLTGDALAQENAWFTSIGSAFKSNPYVWYGTLNEPLDTGSSAGLLGTELASNYQAIRSTGNNNPIMLSLGSGPAPVDTSQWNNIIGDQHFYGWTSGYSTIQSVVTANLNSIVANDAMVSADGRVPLIIGEYGDSTDPSKGLDANGAQVIQAAQQSGLGAIAWAWGVNPNGDGLLDGNGGLSGFGQTVAAWIKTSGATGCPLSPIPAAFDPSSLPNIPPAVDLSTPTSGPVVGLPGQGVVTDGLGHTYTISADGSAMDGNTPLPGGGGTSQIVSINGILYGKDSGHGPVNPGGWFTYSNGYWTPSAPPPLSSSPVAQMPLTTQPETAPPLLPASTVQTAPPMATSPLSVDQVAAIAASGGL